MTDIMYKNNNTNYKDITRRYFVIIINKKIQT